jgi:hypothetical protein
MRSMQWNVKFGHQLSIYSKDRGKPREILIELAGRRTFRLRIDFEPAVRHLKTRAQTVVPICAVALFLKHLYRLVSFFRLCFGSEAEIGLNSF